MTEKREYGLYVVRPEDIPETEQRYLITPDYCLLYTPNMPPRKSAKVTSLEKLPTVAYEWLKEQVESVRKEYIAERSKEILTEAKAFHDVFRGELEKERREVERKGEDHGEPTESTGSI